MSLADAYWVRTVLRPLMEQKDPRALELVHAALRPILLRRTKDTRMPDGSPLIRLPARHVVVERLLFSAEERDFYDALRSRSQVPPRPRPRACLAPRPPMH